MPDSIPRLCCWLGCNRVRRLGAGRVPRSRNLAGNHFTILDPAAPGNRTADIVKRHILADLAESPRVSAEGTEWRMPVAVTSKRPTEPSERLEGKSAVENFVLASDQSVGESRSRVALNIHTAIPLPDHADSSLSTEFPDYVERDIDAALRAWIRRHVQTGGMVVLVGDAASGKTRCLYEALYAEVPDWRMPRMDTGAQINAMVQEHFDLSRTVLCWMSCKTFLPMTA